MTYCDLDYKDLELLPWPSCRGPVIPKSMLELFIEKSTQTLTIQKVRARENPNLGQVLFHSKLNNRSPARCQGGVPTGEGQPFICVQGAKGNTNNVQPRVDCFSDMELVQPGDI